MTISRTAKYAAGTAAAVALLAGCTSNGASGLTPGGSSAAPAARRTLAAGRKVSAYETLVTPRGVKPNLERNIRNERAIRPNCCALQKTLFVTDSFGGSSFTGSVYMFDYVTGEPLGQVAAPPEGFLEVQGACSDDNGNVYFANTEESTIDEYTHSGSFVTALSDPGQFPVGCAYDRSSGNLAVSNIINASGGPGSISIYHEGVLQNTYFPPNMARVYFDGYQGKTGTLWLSGSDSSGFFQYDSFSGGSFANVGVHGATVGFPGTVAWSAKTKFMNVGDQDTFSAPTLYQVDDTGDVRGSTVLDCEQTSDFCDPVQMTIKGPGVVAPDAILLGVARFPYPAGGEPVLQYVGPFVQPGGSAISPDKTGGDE